MSEPLSEQPVQAADVKQCCAALYGSDAARFLLGDSFHPGGTELTLQLGGLLALDASRTVLDIASGTGASAFALEANYGCAVTGIDLSEPNVRAANAEAEVRGVASKVRFIIGDAEHLPFPADAFDALICECAFCTFPDKAQAATEFARVLRPGGRIGLSDLTRVLDPFPELDGLLAWIACIGDAQPLGRYAQWLSDAGFAVSSAISRDDALKDMVEQIARKVLVADIMIGLQKIDLPQFDIARAKSLLAAAQRAVQSRQLGYAILVAEKPSAAASA